MSPMSSAAQAEQNAQIAQAQQTTQAEQWEIVNRVVFPVKDQDLTMPLYVIEWTRPHLTDATFDPRVDMRSIDFHGLNKSGFQRLVNEMSSPQTATSSNDVFHVIDRQSLEVLPGKHISACTFFNAFPAGYWKQWTNVTTVKFQATVTGKGSLTLFRSTGRGLFSPTGTLDFDSSEPQLVEALIPMTNLIDGGYFWFDAQSAIDTASTITNASWSVPTKARTARVDDGPTSLSIAITTFNRAPYCHNQLKAIAADGNLRARLDTVYCVDQGTDLVANQPGFDETASNLGTQLTYIRQANLGGSGGFSRGMYETVKAQRSTYTMLLDDDAISEPESILRAVQFADYTKRPTIVGGGMFHLDNRTILYTQGERFNRSNWWYGSTLDLEYNHDYARFPLRDSPERHRRVDTDFNGWWMCLIPVAIIKEIGLSLPIFIKFDDTEYSLRAAEHGYRTVCLPGVAVWHQAWHDKDPARTWEEYFFQRNRWICALLHAKAPSRRFIFEMLYGDVNVGLKFVYSALKLRHMGLRDIMKGPQYIVESMPTKLAEVRKAREGFADTQTADSSDAFPEPRREFHVTATPTSPKAIRNAGLKAIAKAVVSRQNGLHDERPDVAIPAKDTIWRSYIGVNSALVTSPDGNSVAWCRRDSKLYRHDLREGLKLSRTLLKRWNQLAKAYRSYDMASIDVWERIFQATAKKETQHPRSPLGISAHCIMTRGVVPHWQNHPTR